MQRIRATKLPYSVRRYGRVLFVLKLFGREITSAVNTEMLHELMTSSNIPLYIPQDARLYSLLYLETALHVSAGTSTFND